MANDSESGQIKFCIRTDINNDIEGHIKSIKFVKASITVNINLDGNFEIQPVVIQENTDLRCLILLKNTTASMPTSATLSVI